MLTYLCAAKCSKIIELRFHVKLNVELWTKIVGKFSVPRGTKRLDSELD